MKIIIGDTYDDMCRLAVNDLLSSVENVLDPLICATSGDSPKGVYKMLAEKVSSGGLDISRWKFISLDEWAGMNRHDEGSCGWHLHQQLFLQLTIDESHLAIFDGRAKDLEAECNRIDKFINENGGINIAFVGLGLNGHVGMNEPGTPPSLLCHIAEIDASTQLTGQKYFSKQTTLTHGITLGLANLLESKKVMMLVNGRHKASIVKSIVESPVSEDIPATLLRGHKDLTIYLDKEAAALLQNQ